MQKLTPQEAAELLEGLETTSLPNRALNATKQDTVRISILNNKVGTKLRLAFGAEVLAAAGISTTRRTVGIDVDYSQKAIILQTASNGGYKIQLFRGNTGDLVVSWRKGLPWVPHRQTITSVAVSDGLIIIYLRGLEGLKLEKEFF